MNDNRFDRHAAPSATIIGCNPNGTELCAAAARISTTKGSALALFDQALQADNNLGLVRKVLSSGHKSVMEHACFNLAFNNVSIFAEQFLIEFRLASYTVKSRRYVDFSRMGYYVNQDAPDGLQRILRENTEALFDIYARLLELGTPKEDARFVLPYCVFSNFFCTCNARELLHMICSMVYGRGRVYPEILAIGAQLRAQFEAYFPGVVEPEAAAYAAEEPPKGIPFRRVPQTVARAVRLVDHTACPDEALQTAFGLTGNDPSGFARSPRPRELELLRYTYRIEGLSLAAVTHLVRHRMQSVLVPPVFQALQGNRHILPQSISACDEALLLYERAFARNADGAAAALAAGAADGDLVYFALGGHTLDVLTSMNGRALMHFLLLRTCTRAQWEIREIALEMLRQAKAATPSVVSGFGPACFMLDGCTEGRMSCGRADEVARMLRAL